MEKLKNFFHKEKMAFPETLKDFGYEFKDGKMRDIKTGDPFKFVVREGDQQYNQAHYEAVGEIVTQEVYKLLEEDCGLKKSPVPFDAEKDDPQSFIFLSDDAMTNQDKLLILIHGSGVVRAGQWARRLIINDSLDSGTQIPFIKRAQAEGYGVLVMNTNDNYCVHNGRKTRIKGSETPEVHAAHVWKNYIRNAKAKRLAIIAHSFGGCVTTALFQKFKVEFTERVFAVAMTDSVHFCDNAKAFKNLIKVSRNWVRSEKPLDTMLEGRGADVERVSAGVTAHEETSWASFSSIFDFLEEKNEEKNEEEKKNEENGGEKKNEENGGEKKNEKNGGEKKNEKNGGEKKNEKNGGEKKNEASDVEMKEEEKAEKKNDAEGKNDEEEEEENEEEEEKERKNKKQRSE